MKKLFTILALTAIFLGLCQLFLSGFLGAQVVELGAVEKKATLLEEENRKLEEEIAQKSSLKNVLNRAIELGFKAGVEMVSYRSEKPVALKP